MEPKGPVFPVPLKALFTELKSLLYLSFSLLVLGGLQVDRAVRLTVTEEVSEGTSRVLLIANATLKERPFKQHSPGAIDRQVLQRAQ